MHCGLDSGHPHSLIREHENSVAFIALKFQFRCFLTHFKPLRSSHVQLYIFVALFFSSSCNSRAFESFVVQFYCTDNYHHVTAVIASSVQR